MDNINIIDTSKELRYVEVYNKLFKMITEGSFPKNSRLPSEPELAKTLGVSRSTLRQALALLQDDGLIKNIRGKGNYITKENTTKKNGLEKIGHVIYKCLEHPISNVEFDFKIEPPSDYFTKILGKKSAATVVIDRWYNNNKEALAYTFTIIPIEVISNFKINLNNKEELIKFIEEEIYKECLSSKIHIKFSTTGNFITKGHPISCENQFYLIEESLYKSGEYPIAFNKHYIPIQYGNIEINSHNSIHNL
ncbi:GntR family transcriptional regulator [Clostridium tarantellae]|uniref:GntR family transcriptional regulator n=1 Tax=Clostridium tarantellae TaxID=39493 RepID=A0A6I1MLX1_9CLOT|nr:GntR family transcriptional regulator [Clostridium tarantellae]MPQ43232.1 GntR family transcriptional regulator [Clostridium tarantellae]